MDVLKINDNDDYDDDVKNANINRAIAVKKQGSIDYHLFCSRGLTVIQFGNTFNDAVPVYL